MLSAPLTLQRAAWRLDIDPSFGGSVRGLWHGDIEVLRPTRAGARHASQTAAFPLVPYSNRIGLKTFVWQGERHRLESRFDDGPHALHGVGHDHPWQVVEQGTDHARLRLQHAPDASWPFAFVAEQAFALRPDGLNLTLSLRNTDARSQPAGLGWHPYFPRRPGVRLRGDAVHTQWLPGPDALPVEARPRAGLHEAVDASALDHCFSSEGPLGFSDAVMGLELSASSAHWVVYTPPGADFFCLEPVTHVNNAIQSDEPLARGLVALASGQTLRQSLTLRVSWV